MKRFASGHLLRALTLASLRARKCRGRRPSFAIKMPTGRPDPVEPISRKVVVCEFLFTTCPHCQHASQLMSRAADRVRPERHAGIGSGVQ